jgi:hypothetical protein
METIVTEYDLCNKSKTNRYAPYGLLQLILVLQKIWKSIVFDFIIKFLSSKELITKILYNSI